MSRRKKLTNNSGIPQHEIENIARILLPDTVTMRLSAYSNFSDGEKPEAPDTGLKLIKLEKGTDTPLSGAIFEVVDPDGATVGTFATGSDGTVTIPLTLAGNYTVYERVAPLNHLLSDTPAQNIKVEYGKVAELTCWNEPYGTLRIEKLSDTGAHLPGAMVQIKHIESGVTYTAETNFAGYVIFDNIKPGAYEIKEITAPSGWLKDDATYTASVATGETTTFSLVNKELPGLRIIKYDRKNMVAMANVTFEVWRDGVSLGKFRTDEFGEILLTDAAPGTYRAVEVDTGSDGHILDTTPQEVELSAGDGIKELLFFNDVKPGMRLIKVDSTDPSKVIPNAVFEIKSVAGDYGPKEFTTDQNGEIDLSKLPTGAYVMTEKACEGYIIDQAQRIIVEELSSDSGHVIGSAPQTAYISGKQQDVVQLYFGNSPKGSLLVKKIDSATHKPLSNVEFMVTTADGTVVGDANGKFVTDSAGSFTVSGINPGTTLVVKETRTKSGYVLDDTPQTATIKAGQTVTLEFRNQPQGSLIINKLSSADKKTPLEGVLFQITYSDGSFVDNGALSSKGLYRTDKNGQIILSGITGTVIVTEVETIKGYRIDDASRSQTIEVRANDTQQLWFYNAPTSRILLHKVDKATGKGIYGAVFLLYDSNHNPIGEYVTDQDGYIYADEGLADGRYYLREIKAAPGYVLDPELKTIYVRYGSTTEIEWSNTAECGQIQIIKKSADDNATNGLPAGTLLEGAVFEIYDKVGNVVDTIKSDRNGRAISKTLPLSRYTVREIKAPANYSINPTVMTA